MKTVKKTKEFHILKKSSGRYAVKGANKKWINGDDKVKILVAEGLIEAPKVKAPEPEEAPAEESAAE